MQQVDKASLIAILEEIEQRHKAGRLKKFLTHPIWTLKTSIISRLLHQVLKDKLVLQSRVRLFFGEYMYLTFPPYYDIKFYKAYCSHDYEIRLTKFFIKTFREGDLFFDIGANQGYYSLLASKFVSRVFAFEPDPQALKILRKNQRNNIEIIDKAVSDINGFIEFYSSKYSTLSTFSTQNIQTYRVPATKILIETITLDRFCSERNIYPNIIKIDVEGSEEKVLKGALNILHYNNPTIVMEIFLKPFMENYRNSLQLLEKNNYIPYRINKEGEIYQFNYDKIINYAEQFNLEYGSSDIIILDNLVFKK